MRALGIVGGTGLSRLEGLETTQQETLHTPFGDPSGPLRHGRFRGRPVVFLARHGDAHAIPPHQVNYRANIWALHHVGVRRVIAVAAVGGIRHDMCPGGLAIPDQLIDYTWGRSHTFFGENLDSVTHIDFTNPYSPELRELLIEAARLAAVEVTAGGTYGVTQGPRLETAREIDRLERDGCDLVGMTALPEAALARELALEYAACAVIVNWAAGRGEGEITPSLIERYLGEGMGKVARLLEHAVALV